MRHQPLWQPVVPTHRLRPPHHPGARRLHVPLDLADHDRGGIERARPLRLRHHPRQTPRVVPAALQLQTRQLQRQQRGPLRQTHPGGEQQVSEGRVAIGQLSRPPGVRQPVRAVPAQSHIHPAAESPRRQPAHLARARILRPRYRHQPGLAGPTGDRTHEHRVRQYVVALYRPPVQPRESGQSAVPPRPADSARIPRRASPPVLEVPQIVRRRLAPPLPATPQEIEEQAVVVRVVALRLLRETGERRPAQIPAQYLVDPVVRRKKNRIPRMNPNTILTCRQVLPPNQNRHPTPASRRAVGTQNVRQPNTHPPLLDPLQHANPTGKTTPATRTPPPTRSRSRPSSCPSGCAAATTPSSTTRPWRPCTATI